MLRNRKAQRLLITVIALFSSAGILVAQDSVPVFYFGGKKFFVGMSEKEARGALSGCCKLSPDTVTDAQRKAAASISRTLGQFILPKEDSELRILGTIFFEGGKVVGVTRPLGEEAFIPWNEDVLGFARTLERTISPLTGDYDTTAYITVRHEHAVNSESVVLSIRFSNGRGIRVNMVRLDKPFEGAPAESKDQVNLEEFLQ